MAHTRLRNGLLRGVDEVVDLCTEHAANDFVQGASIAQRRVLGTHLLRKPLKQGDLRQLLQRQQTRANPIVDVVGVVGNFVGQVAQLRFQAGLLPQQKPLRHPAGLLRFKAPRIGQRAMLEDAFSGFKAQVQPVVIGVALFQFIDHPQALKVVLKALVVAHAVVQGVLPGVTKRGVPQIVGQGNGFHQVFVPDQGARHRAGQLRHFQGMGEAGSKQVALVVQKHLGFVDQAAKRRGVNDAVAVALMVVAGGRGCFRVTAPARLAGPARLGRQRHAQHASMTSLTSASEAP